MSAKARAGKGGRASKPVTFEAVREIALALPGAEEGTSYGTPAFFVRKKLFARLREDGESLVVKIDLDARDVLTEAKPAAFYVTDHYRAYPMMLVRLSAVHPDEIAELIEGSWRRCAPKRLLAEHDQGRG